MTHNLPAEFDPFIGRMAVRQQIHACLEQPWCGVVTLVGLGGVGKTRLAANVARDRRHHYPDGVWLVGLTDLEPKMLDASMCMAVAITAVLDLPWREGEDPMGQIVRHLQNKSMLLLLDGVEHLAPDHRPALLSIAQRCPGVDLLVTSRVAAELPAGRTVALTGLAHPSSDDDEGPYEAVDLFTVRRAQHQWTPLTDEDRRAIRRICRRVEGLPLAIELAAGLTREMTLPEIADALEEGLDILATSLRDATRRHRNLRAVFETSWRGLNPELQQCLARLAMLDGSFAARAARQAAGATPQELAALCDHSLLMADAETGRYRLHPVVRAYAAAKRSTGD